MFEVSAATPFILEEFHVRPGLNEIEGPDGTVRVNPKAMELLVVLAGRPEELGTKRELLDAVWTDLFVSEEVLSTAVWELRRALKDSARAPRFIQTLSGKGYRLMVRPSRAPENGVGENGSTAGLLTRSVILMLGISLVLVCVAVGVIRMTGTKLTEQRGPVIRSLVVLPIDDLGDDPHDQALADGLSDTLMTALARIDGLRVVSRTTSLTYRNRMCPISEIAAELGVDAVVEGTLARAGDRIVLNVQLIDVAAEDHIWAETYERRFANLLDLQVEVARSIGAAISNRLKIRNDLRTPVVVESPPGETLLRWRFRTGGEVWSTPVAVGGAVIFGSRDGMLYAVNAADGEECWRLRIGNEVLTTALVLDDAVFAVARNGTVVAAGVRDGVERWRFHIGCSVESPLVGEKGILVAADERGRVVALDATSGRELWNWSSAKGVDGLACRDGHVVASGFDGHVTLLDAIDGQALWRVKVAEWLRQPATINGREIIVPAHGEIISLDVGDGTELWRAAIVAGSEVTTWRDRVFIGGNNSSIRALEMDSGDELWRFEALAATTKPSIEGGIVFSGSRDGNLYAIDAWTGVLLWRVEMRNWVTTSAVEIDGAYVFGSLDGSLFALNSPGSDSVVVREQRGFKAEREEGDERRRDFDIVRIADGGRRPSVRWRYLTDGPVNHSAVLDDSCALVAGFQTLASVDLKDGEERWLQRLPGEAGTGPVLALDLVVIGTRDGFVVAYDFEAGEERWRFETGGAVISTPVVANGTLYFGSRDGFFYAIEAFSGTELWRRQLDIIHASPLVLGNEVWVASRGDKVSVLNAKNGRILRSMATADWVVADPVGWQDRVLLASCDGSIVAVAEVDGKEFWRFVTHGDVWYHPLVHDGRYFFGSADHHLYALDVETGRELWRRRTQNKVLSSVASWRDLVFAGSYDHSLHAFQADDGTALWRLATTGPVSNPVVSGDLLGVGSFDGYFYLLDLDDADQ